MSTSNVRSAFELTGRNYIVTGGAQGIGFTISRAICEMGGNVAIWDIQEKPVDQKELDSWSSTFGSKTVYVQTDVTKQDSLEAAFQKTLDVFKTIDGCVPSAGIAIDKPFIDQTWEEFTRIQEINVRIGVPGLDHQRLLTHLQGAWYILHSSDGRPTLGRAKETRQHPTHRLSIGSHRLAGLQNGRIQCLERRRHDACQSARSRAGASRDPRQHHLPWLRGL